MCKWGTTEAVTVTIPAYLSCTGKEAIKTKKIDKCIASIVRALNQAGIRTDSSCCGHDKREGYIVLNDTRVLIIRKDAQSRITIFKDVKK